MIWVATSAVILLAPSLLTITIAIPIGLQNELTSRSLPFSNLPHQPLAPRILANEYPNLMDDLPPNVDLGSLRNKYVAQYAPPYLQDYLLPPILLTSFDTVLRKLSQIPKEKPKEFIEETVELIVLADYLVAEKPYLLTDDGKKNFQLLGGYLSWAERTLPTNEGKVYDDLRKLIRASTPKYPPLSQGGDQRNPEKPVGHTKT
ncbi:hypothetical protein H0H93_015449 [Arthromyces matolae]|nr:hypothetical protein H0H93_015449 [Arthromyces matolae]